MFKRKYFVKVGSLAKIAHVNERDGGKIFWKKFFPLFLFLSGISLLILSAFNFWKGYEKHSQKYLVHNYVLINDGSGSMAGWGIETLLFGNKVFFETLKTFDRKEDERDLVAQAVFSDGAYVVSYFGDSYDNLYKKMELINWETPPLNGGTDAGSGFWSAIQLVLKKNSYNGGSNYSSEEMSALIARVRGWENELVLTDVLKEKTATLEKELTGYVFIMFTDGSFTVSQGDKFISPRKVLDLCKGLGIKVYIISVGSANVELEKLVESTGGGMFFIESNADHQSLAGIYKKIAEEEGRSTVDFVVKEKRYYYRWFAIPAFALLFFWIVLKNTVSRSLTEP